MSDTSIKDFEGAIAELESIVKKLEEGDLALEQSLALYERGVQLSRSLQPKRLEAGSGLFLPLSSILVHHAEHKPDDPGSNCAQGRSRYNVNQQPDIAFPDIGEGEILKVDNQNGQQH